MTDDLTEAEKLAKQKRGCLSCLTLIAMFGVVIVLILVVAGLGHWPVP